MNIVPPRYYDRGFYFTLIPTKFDNSVSNMRTTWINVVHGSKIQHQGRTTWFNNEMN